MPCVRWAGEDGMTTEGGLDPSPEVPPRVSARLPLRPLAYALLVIGLIAVLGAGFLAFRFAERARHRFPPHPIETDVAAIQGWMTIPYVARAYHVPEPELFKAVGADPHQARDQSLNQI